MSNTELQDQIVQYYESGYGQMKDWSSYHSQSVLTNMEPFVLQELPYDQNELTDPLIVIKKLEDFRFTNLINLQIVICDGIRTAFENALVMNQELLAAIRKEQNQ